MPGAYIPIFIFAVIVAAVPVAGFALARRAGRNGAAAAERTNAATDAVPFEETERRRNTSQIFLAGTLFVLCDTALVFLILWAVRMEALGFFGLIAAAGFLGALGCGYIWLYKHRALERL